MPQSGSRSRYLLALIASAAGIAGLLLFPLAFRTTPFFPATGVGLFCVLVLGVAPAVVAQASMLAVTMAMLARPGSALADPTVSIVRRLGMTVVLFVLVDGLAWWLERSRRAAAVQNRALWDSEIRYRHILEQASDGIVLASAEGKLLLVNQRICEMLGYTEAEILALPIGALFVGGGIASVPSGNNAERNAGVLEERELRRRDGSTLQAELGLRRTAEGSVQAIVRDITERRRAEAALRSEHALLESILATSVTGILVMTPEGRVVFLNRMAESALGVTREELADRTTLPPAWRLLTLDGQLLPDSERPSRRVVATGEPVQDVWLIAERPSGERRVLSINAAPLRDESRRITAVVLSLSDITEQQRAQEAIEDREEQLERITAAVPGMVYQFGRGADGRGRFLFVSARARELFGVSAEEIVADGTKLLALIDPDDLAAVATALQGLAPSREPMTFDFRAVRAGAPGDPPRWFRTVTRATPGREGGLVRIGVVVDITDQRRLEEELRQSQKMDSLGRLAGGVAHDFNNLLTVIRGYADVLHGELSPEDPRLAEVREIRLAADRAASLTRQLLAVSRRQMLVPREVDLNTLVQDMERMLRRVIGEGIRVATGSSPDLGWVRADPGQLEQVLLNLAVNARDAMPSGGTLTIETSRLRLDPGHEEPSARGVPCGDYVVVRVSDTGTGMDREIQSKIFEPFFTTKPLGEGTGLGLSTVYGIVQQSSGFITVESEPGSGSSFRVFLPRLKNPAGIQREAATARPAVPAGQPRAAILLVEDDDGVRHLSARVLGQYGYEVLEARDGAEALELLSEGARQVDAVVSDVVMPGISGTELLTRLRLRWPELPVLFLSGYTGDEVHEEVRPGAHQAFLQKPFSPEGLAAALGELLADTRPPATAG